MRPAALLALFASFAIGAVYLTVWPHEVGHASVAWLYGCKADPWRTDTHWYLAGSRAGAVDQVCLTQWGGEALGVMALSGTGVNLLLFALAPLFGRWWLPGRTARGTVRWGLVATLLWALSNAAEALSYLVINTVWLRTDMALVALSGLGRWRWTLAGLVLAVIAGRVLRGPLREASTALATPERTERFWRWTFTGYALAVGLAAVASRALLA